MLQRQANVGPSKRFSVRAPQKLVDEVENFAYENRMTQAALVTRLLSKALRAENGETYQPELRKEASA